MDERSTVTVKGPADSQDQQVGHVLLPPVLSPPAITSPLGQV